MKTIICKLILILLFFNSLAQEKSFIREYYYRASEDDSKITSRQKALTEVKKLLIEELGIYVESYVNWERKEENNVLSKDFFTNEIKTLSAGITETKIIEENWNGSEYYIKAEIKTDPNEVLRKINQTISIRKANTVIDSLKLLLSESNKLIKSHNQEVESIKGLLNQKNIDIQEKQKDLINLNQQLLYIKKQLETYEIQEKKILSEIEVIETKIKDATNKALNNIRLGMTNPEVIQLCGEPRSKDECMKVLFYNYGEVWVLFESNIVTSIFRATQFKGRCWDVDYYRKINIR